MTNIVGEEKSREERNVHYERNILTIHLKAVGFATNVTGDNNLSDVDYRDGFAIFLSISSPQRLQRDNVVGNEGMTNIVGKLREEQTTTVR